MQFNPEVKEALIKYFTFSRREYKASIALLLITLSLWFLPDLINWIYPPKFDSTLIMQKAAQLDALKSKPSFDSTQNERPNYEKMASEENSPPYFNFNPNTATDDELKKLGFSKRQIHTIRNYLLKIGEIKSKAVFKKIYGIPAEQYLALEPYISLPENEFPEKSVEKNKNSISKIKLSVELNTADSNELDKLPGIGMGYARRILKYRNALGGFVHINQLLEVYGFRASLLDSISPFLTLDASKHLKMNINSSTVEMLKVHPYLRYKLANAIVNYRLQHGNYNTVDDLKNVVLISSIDFDKIKFYLSVD